MKRAQRKAAKPQSRQEPRDQQRATSQDGEPLINANGRKSAYAINSSKPSSRPHSRPFASIRGWRVQPHRLVLAGVGNIGSQFVDQLARLPGLERVLVVDRDRYEAANLLSQAITERDVGRPKATVQARRLRQLNPRLQVEAFAGDLETLPLAWLRGAIVVGCLDSLHARLRLGEMAWRVGAPFLDGGVNPEASLARVTWYLPGPDGPCCACGLSVEDYATLGSVHPCAGGQQPSATAGPFSLGGLAATWLAIECERLLTGGPEAVLAGREVLLETRAVRLLVSRRQRNPSCRFDHATWRIEPFTGLTPNASLADALASAKRILGASDGVALSLPGQRLAQALHCPGCGAMVRQFHVVGRGASRLCRRCRERTLAVTGFEIMDRLDAQLPPALVAHSLHRLGIRPGDIVAAESGGHRRYLEIPREAK